MGVWLRRIITRIGELQVGALLLNEACEREKVDESGRMNVHLAEDGTVSNVDFK